ncbi:hypothetical protein CIK05_02080 [Bdellovibrio sp. qaytius]|nr:hypothetical protein CIK05_02080 [Bdellovibrio sp. qaytius]
MSSSNLPDFNKLWNFSKPAETEIKFRETLAEVEVNADLDYILQLKTQIARAEGLQRKFDEAHKTLDTVEIALDATTPVAEIRYNLERGRVFNSSKQKDKAIWYFRKAFNLADAAKQEDFAVDAAHMVAIAEPTAEAQMQWNLKAVALAESATEQKAKDWLGSLYNNIGWTYHDSGQFIEALEIFKKALAFRETKGDASTIRIAKWCIARTHRSLNNLAEALVIQKSLEKEFNAQPQQDGYNYEELAEIYLKLNFKEESKKYFALAFNELNKDEWFKSNEAVRLARIKELSFT